MAETYLVWWFLLFLPLALMAVLQMLSSTASGRAARAAYKSTLFASVLFALLYGTCLVDALINQKISLPSRIGSASPVYRAEDPGRFWFDTSLAFLIVSGLTLVCARGLSYRKRNSNMNATEFISAQEEDLFLSREPLGFAIKQNVQLNYYPVTSGIRVVITEPPGAAKNAMRREFGNISEVAKFITEETSFDLADFKPIE